MNKVELIINFLLNVSFCTGKIFLKNEKNDLILLFYNKAAFIIYFLYEALTLK